MDIRILLAATALGPLTACGSANAAGTSSAQQIVNDAEQIDAGEGRVHQFQLT